jgi:HEAT repeat protein
VARRRRSVAIAGRAGDEETVRAGLRDPEPAVRAAALSALARGGWAQERDGAAASRDSSAAVRARACELAAAVPGVELARLLDDDADAVVEAAAFGLGEAGDGGDLALDALARVATGHRDALCRESAVAALGAIGDQRSLPAILAALSDRPAVRRRATISLAPFEGPEVAAALARSLEDRDWQVRQAAEELLEARGPAG